MWKILSRHIPEKSKINSSLKDIKHIRAFKKKKKKKKTSIQFKRNPSHDHQLSSHPFIAERMKKKFHF